MNNHFGNNLKRLRISKKYTQEQAAQLLNISPKSLSRWECGSTMPDIMMLPEIAKIYCVTVDDLYKEQSIAYENYAQRLMSVYESTHDINDFFNAEREFAKLLKSNEYTIKDVCIYAILYQFQMQDCRDKALSLFRKGLDMGVDNDPDTYHWIERQRMLMLSQIGKDDENIEEQTANFKEIPHDLYSHINLLAAHLFANNTQKALDIFLEAEKEFDNQPILYIYGGDIYRRLKMYDKAFLCWDKSLTIDTGFTDAMWSKATCYEELGDYQSAYKMWTEIIDWYETRGYEIEATEPRKRARFCKDKVGS